MGPTAAFLVVGNELLSGKVQDTNTALLARVLRECGVELRRVVTVPDERDLIAAEVNALRNQFDWLFTSGGVGPTHDDVTVASVAWALGRAVLRSPRLEALLRGYYGARCTEDHLRMADLVEGTELVDGPGTHGWPTMLLGNIAILPGVPSIFAGKVESLRHRLCVAGAAPFVSASVYCKGDEGALRPLIDAAVARDPELSLGSYPRFDAADHTLRITFDGRDAQRVRSAAEAFAAALPEGALVRVE